MCEIRKCCKLIGGLCSKYRVVRQVCQGDLVPFCLPFHPRIWLRQLFLLEPGPLGPLSSLSDGASCFCSWERHSSPPSHVFNYILLMTQHLKDPFSFSFFTLTRFKPSRAFHINSHVFPHSIDASNPSGSQILSGFLIKLDQTAMNIMHSCHISRAPTTSKQMRQSGPVTWLAGLLLKPNWTTNIPPRVSSRSYEARGLAITPFLPNSFLLPISAFSLIPLPSFIQYKHSYSS
ncbi:hypothetical protein VP01_1962g1 [Puccinia sorghi]|uniref:Uncharacterized protein n=1 Tax=Puccinia sorghi TaxID=27349 RepID=A0A0L6VDQ6_9BASI|nr:hypothetical protein VP01_1962g1 [Puccinia sorghi]